MADAGARASAPAQGLLHLFFTDDGSAVLAHAVTGELHLVQPGPGLTTQGLELEFDGDGDAFLVWPDGSTSWVQRSAQLHEQGGFRYVQTDSGRKWLHDWHGDFRICILGLRTRAHHRQVDLQIARFEHANVGQHIWWSWDSILEFAGFR